MPRSHCEFHGETRAKAEAALIQWKKVNVRGVALISQIVDNPSESGACVIRVEYEHGD